RDRPGVTARHVNGEELSVVHRGIRGQELLSVPREGDRPYLAVHVRQLMRVVRARAGQPDVVVPIVAVVEADEGDPVRPPDRSFAPVVMRDLHGPTAIDRGDVEVAAGSIFG